MRSLSPGIACLALLASLPLLLVGCGTEEGADAAQEPFTVELVTEATTAVGGDPILLPPAGEGQFVAHLVEVAPGGETGRHRHPGPTFMYVLEGTIAAELDDGTSQAYGAGEAFVEPVGAWINNRNPGDAPARFLGVIVSGAGEPPVVFPEN